MGILQGRDCTVCSLKWIKHDGSAGTEAVPVEVGGEDAYFQKANYTPPHRDYMCLRVAEGQLVGRGGRWHGESSNNSGLMDTALVALSIDSSQVGMELSKTCLL